MNNEYLELENPELWIILSSLGIVNNSKLLNNPIKTEDERNDFNFSAHRRQWNPLETREIQTKAANPEIKPFAVYIKIK